MKDERWREQNALFLHYKKNHPNLITINLTLSDAYQVVFLEKPHPSNLDIRESFCISLLKANISIAKTCLPKYWWWFRFVLITISIIFIYFIVFQITRVFFGTIVSLNNITKLVKARYTMISRVLLVSSLKTYQNLYYNVPGLSWEGS